jgi:hypothetical protein
LNLCLREGRKEGKKESRKEKKYKEQHMQMELKTGMLLISEKCPKT